MSQRDTEEHRQHWEFRRKCRQPTLLQLFTSALLCSSCNLVALRVTGAAHCRVVII